MRIFILIFMAYSIFGCEHNRNSRMEVTDKSIDNHCDSISFKSYSRMIDDYMENTVLKEFGSIEELRTVIKLYNTSYLVHKSDSINNKGHIFRRFFETNLIDYVIKTGEFHGVGKGMTLYSSKLELYLIPTSGDICGNCFIVSNPAG